MSDLSQPRSEGNPHNEGKETAHYHNWTPLNVSLENDQKTLESKLEDSTLGGHVSEIIWTP